MNGPYDTRAQVEALPEVRAVHEAFAADPGAGKMAPHSRRLLGRALEDAGVQMGAHDGTIADWLAGWEPATVAVIAGWVTRAAGRRLAADDLAVILAALDDAARLARQQAAICLVCETHPASLCAEHAEKLRRAESYAALAGRLRGGAL